MNFDNEVPRRRFDDWIESQANQAGAERLFRTCKWTDQLEQFQSKIRNPKWVCLFQTCEWTDQLDQIQSKIRNLKSEGLLCDLKWKLACQVWNMQALGQILE